MTHSYDVTAYVDGCDVYCTGCGKRLRLTDAVLGEIHGDSITHCANGATCVYAIDLCDYGLKENDKLVGAENRYVGEIVTTSLTDDGICYTCELFDERNKTPFQRALHRLYRQTFPELGIWQPLNDGDTDNAD